MHSTTLLKFFADWMRERDVGDDAVPEEGVRGAALGARFGVGSHEAASPLVRADASGRIRHITLEPGPGPLRVRTTDNSLVGVTNT